MVTPFSKFYGKIWVSFCVNIGKPFFLEVSFSAQQKEHRFLKTTRDFQNSPPLKRSESFYVMISENPEHFQYFNFETDFLENKTFFKKMEYSFLVECTKIEKASFPYEKNCHIRSHAKTNRMVTSKWAYHGEQSFTSNYFIFLKVLFQFKNLF